MNLKEVIPLCIDSTVCPTCYRTRHFLNNSNTNEDITTKFEQEYVRCVRNEEECVCSVCLSRRDEVTGEWRRLHNEELNDLYSSPNIVRVIKSRRMRWAGNMARMGEERGIYRVLVGKPEGRRPLRRLRRRWVDNKETA